jgi:hypothetical protein
MKKEPKDCLNCGQPLDPGKGRVDRLYCDERCKNAFHNARSIEENGELNRIELVLKKNRRVLKKMFARKDKDQISKERLLKEGFDFVFYTHHVTSKIIGNSFTFCFDYGYREVEPGVYKIVKAFASKEA